MANILAFLVSFVSYKENFFRTLAPTHFNEKKKFLKQAIFSGEFHLEAKNNFLKGLFREN